MTLYTKEIRQLLPIAAIIVLLMCTDIIYVLISLPPDELYWTFMTEDLGAGEGQVTAGYLIILALITAYSLFPREHDDRTIDFIHSLPLSRRRIFITKAAAGLSILCAVVMFQEVLNGLLLSLNTQTTNDNQFHLSIAVPLTVIELFYVFIVFSHGLLLSFFYRFGLILYGLIIWAILILEKNSPALAELNFMNLLAHEYHGYDLLIPWHALFKHTVVACLCLLLGYRLWSYRAESTSMAYKLMLQRPWGRMLLFIAALTIVALGYSFFHRTFMDLDEANDSDRYFEPFAVARFQTEHYRFTYTAGLRDVALPLIDRAEPAYDAVRHLLRASATPPIVVDLTERSSEHAGIAGWQKIRMDIRDGLELDEYLRTLHHETTHVFQARESDRRLGDYANSTNFFVEGLADYVAYKTVPDDRKLAAQRLLAALSWRRLRIRFHELADTQVFSARFNENLFYSLGEVWAQALADTCGEKALGDSLRAMADRHTATKDLEGAILWQDRLQSIGCELEAVTAAWETHLHRVLSSSESAARRVPRISGGVTGIENDWVMLVATTDRYVDDPTSGFSVRVRDDPSTPEPYVRHYTGAVRQISEPQTKKPLAIEFWVPTEDLEGRHFEFQFGYRFARGVLPYYEFWQGGVVP